MVRVSQLGEMFKRGKRCGSASNMNIIEGKHFTFLVDFGWAVLAKRSKASGKILYYSGWDGYSPTTSKHISQTGLRTVKLVRKERKRLQDVM